MAVSSPASLSKIRSEFGTGASNLKSFNRGGSYVANHDNNASIASSASSLRISQFLNSDIDFDTLYGSNNGYWSAGQQSGFDSGKPKYEECIGVFTTSVLDALNFSEVTVSDGSRNTFVNVGQGYNTLTQAELIACFDYAQSTVEYDPPSNHCIAFSGDKTGTWWTEVIVAAISLPRSAAFNPSGTYSAFYSVTYWTWSSPIGLMAGDYRIELVL